MEGWWQTLSSVQGSFPAPAAEAPPPDVGWAIAVGLQSNREPQNRGQGSSLPATSDICGQLHARDQIEDPVLWLANANDTLHGSEPRGVKSLGISLVVQSLRLHASIAGGTGLIPGRGTKIPHVARPNK